MDPIAVAVIGGVIGYWIFGDAPEIKTEEPQVDPGVLARIREEERRASIVRAHAEAQQRERRRTFRTAAECFEAQYISYSRLGTYCSCPQKFKLIYLDRAESEASPYYGRGSAFHEAIQEYLAQYIGGYAPRMQSRSLSCRIYPRSERSRSAAKYFSKTFPWDARILGADGYCGRRSVLGRLWHGSIDLPDSARL